MGTKDSRKKTCKVRVDDEPESRRPSTDLPLLASLQFVQPATGIAQTTIEANAQMPQYPCTGKRGPHVRLHGSPGGGAFKHHIAA